MYFCSVLFYVLGVLFLSYAFILRKNNPFFPILGKSSEMLKFLLFTIYEKNKRLNIKVNFIWDKQLAYV